MEPIVLTREEFEHALTENRKKGYGTILKFTATWCGPCKKLDKDLIASAAKEKGIPIYVCDYVTNEYTVGYCMVNSFPTFIAFNLGKEKNRLASNQTEAVVTWIDYVSEK